jgi:hypothetical protein
MLTSMAVAAFRHDELRLESELRWHEGFERASWRNAGEGP